MIDASGEFSVKLLTIGWNIKHANISQPQVLDEKKFEITAKRNDNN
jgi:hypothetical protein